MPENGLAVRFAGGTRIGVPAVLRPAELVGRFRARYLFGVGTLAIAYYAAAHLGYAFEFSGPVAAMVWLPAGVAIAFLYLAGPRFWPGVLVGDLLVNNYGTLPIGSAIGQTCGNILEVVVAALLLRELVPQGSPLATVGGLGRLLIALAAGTAVSATVGALSLWLGNVVTADALPTLWRTWWLGDFSGALIVVPLVLAWYRRPPRLRRGRTIEWVLLLLAIAVLSGLAFMGDRPITYLVFPALIWAALRFDVRGVTVGIAIAAGFTLWQTTHDVGPFAFHSVSHSTLSVQLYLAVMAVSMLCLAAVASEREEYASRLGTSRVRLLQASDTERRRIEHNLHDGAQQRLTALLVRLGLAAEQARDVPERATAFLGEAETELSLAIDELRQLAHGIHPPVLTEFGLARAIRDLAELSSVEIRPLEVPSRRLNDDAEATAYYVVAEAMVNAQKHAHASSIGVRVAMSPRGLRIEVVDDGSGGAVEGHGYGLSGLRDRVEALGGKFEVESAPERGTLVAAVIPATAGPTEHRAGQVP
jgi:signal transduction histidine kinase